MTPPPPVEECPGNAGPLRVAAGRNEFLVDLGKRVNDLPVAELESRVKPRPAEPDPRIQSVECAYSFVRWHAVSIQHSRHVRSTHGRT